MVELQAELMMLGTAGDMDRKPLEAVITAAEPLGMLAAAEIQLLVEMERLVQAEVAAVQVGLIGAVVV
jgi:hypothetical protein